MGGMSATKCELTPMDVGLCHLGKDHVLGDEYDVNDRIPFTMYAYLIQTPDGRKVLVDLGPKTLGYTNDMLARYGFFRTMEDGSRPDDTVQNHGNTLDWLGRLGVRPEEITDVVFTHFHADHHGMDDARDGGMCEDFPNAVFHVSKTGWDFNVGQRVDGKWNSYIDWGFGDFLLRMEKEGRARFHDNAEIAEGVSTLYAGGHSICSQGVRVETDAGPLVITSDDVYHYSLMEQGVMARLFTTPEKLLDVTRMYARMVLDEGATLLPSHDPTVSDLYEAGGDWKADARKLSLAAARGFADRDKTG